MKSSKLSPTMQLNGHDIGYMIRDVFSNFNKIFVDKDARPEYNGVFIFFDVKKLVNGKTLSFPERFMHACSIEDKPNYTIFPCNNEIAYELCNNKCNCKHALNDFRAINRPECLYRLARIHWVPEIINLANLNDKDIKAWTQIETDYKNNKIKKRYIRYECGMDDYVVILKEDWRKNSLRKYIFITAFPVFLKRNKEQFDKNYLKSRKGTAVITVP